MGRIDSLLKTYPQILGSVIVQVSETHQNVDRVNVETKSGKVYRTKYTVEPLYKGHVGTR